MGVGLTLSIIGNIIFEGHTPSPPLKFYIDQLAFILMFWGIAGDILSNITVQKVNNITGETIKVVKHSECNSNQND